MSRQTRLLVILGGTEFDSGVADGSRTHGLEVHNLAL